VRLVGRAEAGVACRFSRAVSTVAISLPNATATLCFEFFLLYLKKYKDFYKFSCVFEKNVVPLQRILIEGIQCREKAILLNFNRRHTMPRKNIYYRILMESMLC